MKKASAIIGFFQRNSVAMAIGLMFFLAWAIDLANSGLVPIHQTFVFYLLLGGGFIFAAVIMTGFPPGRKGAIEQLKRYLSWHAEWNWHLVAFCIALILMGMSVYLNALVQDLSPDFNSVIAYQIFGKWVHLPILILPLFVVDIVANRKEILEQVR